MENKKRLIIRIGAIFCVEVDGLYKHYMQYVTKDESQLYACVVRVFEKKYSIDEQVDMDEVDCGDVWFYAHVYGLRNGVLEGKCSKCGKSKILGNIKDIMFRLYSEGNIQHLTVSHRWYVWKINHEFIDIGDLVPPYDKYDWGAIYPIAWVIEKIKTGKYPFKELK